MFIPKRKKVSADCSKWSDVRTSKVKNFIKSERSAKVKFRVTPDVLCVKTKREADWSADRPCCIERESANKRLSFSKLRLNALAFLSAILVVFEVLG
jgi:hypothetical protein